MPPLLKASSYVIVSDSLAILPVCASFCGWHARAKDEESRDEERAHHGHPPGTTQDGAAHDEGSPPHTDLPKVVWVAGQSPEPAADEFASVFRVISKCIFVLVYNVSYSSPNAKRIAPTIPAAPTSICGDTGEFMNRTGRLTTYTQTICSRKNTRNLKGFSRMPSNRASFPVLRIRRRRYPASLMPYSTTSTVMRIC